MEARLTGLERIEDITGELRSGRHAALCALVVSETMIALLAFLARHDTRALLSPITVQGTLIVGIPLAFVVHAFGRAPRVWEVGVGAGLAALVILLFLVFGWYAVLFSLLINPLLALTEIVFFGLQIWLFQSAIRAYRSFRSARTDASFALGALSPLAYFALLYLAEDALQLLR